MNQLSDEAHSTLARRAIEHFRLVREAVLKQGSEALQQGFRTYGVATDRNAAVIEGSADWAMTSQAAIGVSYSGVIAARSQEHALKAQFGVKF